MNIAILTGRVGNEPEYKIFDNGNTMVSFSLATSKSYKNKSGEKVTETQWHKCSAFGNLSGTIRDHVNKGDMFGVTGEIRYNKVESNGETKFFTEIRVSSIEFFPNKRKEETGDNNDFDNHETPEDDLPF